MGSTEYQGVGAGGCWGLALLPSEVHQCTQESVGPASGHSLPGLIEPGQSITGPSRGQRSECPRVLGEGQYRLPGEAGL